MNGEPPTGTAVEPPEEYVRVSHITAAPGQARARHRLLTLPGGLLLLLAIFLPSMNDCGETHYPLDTPQLLGPYVLGAALAFVSLLAGRIREYGLRIFTVLSLLHYAVLAIALLLLTAQDLEAAGTLVVVLVAGGSVLLVARKSSTIEERGAGITLVQAIQWTLWFTLWNLIEGALIGMRVAVAGALLASIGAAVWLIDSRTRG